EETAGHHAGDACVGRQFGPEDEIRRRDQHRESGCRAVVAYQTVSERTRPVFLQGWNFVSEPYQSRSRPAGCFILAQVTVHGFELALGFRYGPTRAQSK